MLTTVNYLPSTVIHYGMDDGHGNTWPACGTRIGRYALPNAVAADVTCKKCQAL